MTKCLSMKLTSHLPADRRAHVEGRLRANLMAWLTTVRPDGRPDSVPVWFLLRDDETILVYSQPGKMKLRNIIRIDGTAEHVPGFPAADQVPEYAAKYTERIGAIFGTVSQFAGQFPEALIITPHRLHA
jgi:hypothetical protein